MLAEIGQPELKTEADLAAWLFRHGRQWHRRWIDLPADRRDIVTRSLIRRINASQANAIPRNELNEAISEVLGMGAATIPTPTPAAKAPTGRPVTKIVTADQLTTALQEVSTLHEVADKLGMSKKTLWNKIVALPELRAIWDARTPKIDGRSDSSRKETKPQTRPKTTSRSAFDETLKTVSRKSRKQGTPSRPGNPDQEYVNVLIEGALYRMRKIRLQGGQVYIACNINLFSLTKKHRQHIFELIDRLDEIERDHLNTT